MLSILLQECFHDRPLESEPVAAVVLKRIPDKVLDARDIRRHIQEIVLGSFAVEAHCQNFALEFFHHGFEIVVRKDLQRTNGSLKGKRTLVGVFPHAYWLSQSIRN